LDIKPGAWVHVHNCRSEIDERSNQLNIHTEVLGDSTDA
jgi:hypothetical protein